MPSVSGNYVIHQGRAPSDLIVGVDQQGNLVDSFLAGRAVSGTVDPATNGITFDLPDTDPFGGPVNPLFRTTYQGFPLMDAGAPVVNANDQVVRLAGIWSHQGAFNGDVGIDARGGWWARARTGFAADIRPLFRDSDIQGMAGRIDLTSVQDVSNNAWLIYSVLAHPTPTISMPCDGKFWSPEMVGTFKYWIDDSLRP